MDSWTPEFENFPVQYMRVCAIDLSSKPASFSLSQLVTDSVSMSVCSVGCGFHIRENRSFSSVDQTVIHPAWLAAVLPKLLKYLFIRQRPSLLKRTTRTLRDTLNARVIISFSGGELLVVLLGAGRKQRPAYARGRCSLLLCTLSPISGMNIVD